MQSVAQKLPLPYQRPDLVVPAHVWGELDLVCTWARHQHTVLDDWGFARRASTGRGLTALFAGPPGTGKTMAAQIVAKEIGIELYQVDLSRVVSHSLAETETNLRRLFDEASGAGAILLFDEADALFGKRGGVADTRDRLELASLLRRAREHDGLTVLETTRLADLDETSVRRFDVVVDFPPPAPDARLRIWQGMFPLEAPRDADVDCTRLARDFELSGGEIKNAALAAAYLAAAEGPPIAMSHVLRAVRRELTKSGKLVDDRLFAATRFDRPPSR